ncbi:MAG: hypothetical protein COW71_06420 [Ignavibacteriales bacterium CG18_big_fil_WC_8_21_14_2_50_31_20]|nr:MAG: hypothetical protein COW71_06420 [Ignavibacteriales bacterium CG18_big_fil_WC_8_21_14_2_50_31_20]
MHLFLGILFFAAIIIYSLDLFLFRRAPKWLSLTIAIGISIAMVTTAFMHLIFLGLGILIGSLLLLYFSKRPVNKNY